jgi:hypothetical protein
MKLEAGNSPCKYNMQLFPRKQGEQAPMDKSVSNLDFCLYPSSMKGRGGAQTKHSGMKCIGMKPIAT